MSLRSHVEAVEHLPGGCAPATLPGQFIINGRAQPCRIVHLSRNGASITVSEELLDHVQYVAARLRIDGLRLFDVRIRWRSARDIGLSFEKGRLTDAEIAALISID